MRDPRHILITGASSGLGAALAQVYARRGVGLALTGRDEQRLAAVAAHCRAAGSAVNTAVLDVCDRESLAAWIKATDDARPLDLVIANAGISAKTGRGQGDEGGGSSFGLESLELTRRILATNLDGVLNTLEPVLPLMRQRRRGQVALMSSLVAFRGLPGFAAYCASKAAVKVYGEALRCELLGRGVKVSVICPGFVRTPMTDRNRFPMPFRVEPGLAAAIIRLGLAGDQARICFPGAMAVLARLLAVLPPALVDPVLAWAARQESPRPVKRKPVAD
ncbi:Uncharacterized oxidoreductase MXAN_5909 [uncultured Gammaproteobacteria bacterium]